MSNTISIHNSDIEAYLRCRQSWHYSSKLRLGLESKRLYSPFFTGRAIHAAMEAMYNGRSPFVAAQQVIDVTTYESIRSPYHLEQQDMLREQTELVMGMLNYYVEWVHQYNGPHRDELLDFVSMETEFHIPFSQAVLELTPDESDALFAAHPHLMDLLPYIELGGRIDGVARDKSEGMLWLWECKTARSFTEFELHLDRAAQGTFYTWAAGKLIGERVEGVLYNIMRKSYPKPVDLIKGGTELSRNKSKCDVPAEFYLEQIRRVHPGITNTEIRSMYGEILDHLIQAKVQYVKRLPLYKTDQELRYHIKDRCWIVGEMTSPNVHIAMSESPWNCKYCSFKAPCATRKAGGDEQSVLDHGYQPRTPEVHLDDYLTEDNA